MYTELTRQDGRHDGREHDGDETEEQNSDHVAGLACLVSRIDTNQTDRDAEKQMSRQPHPSQRLQPAHRQTDESI